jgi:hypothetical protein
VDFRGTSHDVDAVVTALMKMAERHPAGISEYDIISPLSAENDVRIDGEGIHVRRSPYTSRTVTEGHGPAYPA